MNLPKVVGTAVIAAFAAVSFAGAQSPPPSTIGFLRNAAMAGIEGNRHQEAGRFAEALDRYTAVINFTDRALDDYGRHGIAYPSRPPLVYWLAGRSHFDAARMRIHLRRSPAEVSHHLDRARQALQAVLHLDSAQARRARQRHTPDTWKYEFLRGQIELLRGDLASARHAYEQVARMNPGFAPAVEALAFIGYARGPGVRGSTRDGLALPPKPEPVVAGKQLVELGFAFLGLIYSKYSAEIDFAQQITQALMQ